jgi:CMP-N-acetylneuraminic acid synthetase
VKIINYLVVVPARKNSKRIKNKNLIKIKGKTLINITLDSLNKINKIKHIVVSSDSKKVLQIAKRYRKVLLINRPKRLCFHHSKNEDVIMHAVNYLEKKNFKILNIILLQVTSPLRTAKDILECITVYEQKRLNSIFSVYSSKDFIWEKSGRTKKSISYNFKKRIISQKMKPLFFENGAIYIFNKKKFMKKKNRIIEPFDFFLMPKFRSLDIDTKEDLLILKK